MHNLTDPNSVHQKAQLTATNISINRGGKTVLNQVDLVVTPSSKLAIVGENGRGKSTLLQVLTGQLEPDHGTIRRQGTMGVADQEMDATDDRTVGEAVAEAIALPLAALKQLDEAAEVLSSSAGSQTKTTSNTTKIASEENAATAYAEALELAESLNAWDAERDVQIALEALEAPTDPQQLLRHLSVGQRYRVRLACLLGANDDFLLLDEPTNHLDRSGLEFLTNKLQGRRGGVVIVSHDRALLTDVAETILDLDPTVDEKPRLYGNGYEGYRVGRTAEMERWQQDYDREQAEHARLEENLTTAQDRLVSKWRPEKGTNKHGRATRAGGLVQTVHRRQKTLEAHAVTIPPPPAQFRFPQLRVKNGGTLLNVDQVSVAGRLPHPVTFSLSRGEKMVVTGPNGAGKSTLLNVISGVLTPDTGVVGLKPEVQLGFLQQESMLPLERRTAEVFEEQIGSLISEGKLAETKAMTLSQLGLLRPDEQGKQIGQLSMGQQRRLDLALVLAAQPQVLLLDEPTNHLSIALVDELTEALSVTEAAVILSTHDRQLLRDVCGWEQLILGDR